MTATSPIQAPSVPGIHPGRDDNGKQVPRSAVVQSLCPPCPAAMAPSWSRKEGVGEGSR